MQAIATVTFKGQVTIPKQFREVLGVDDRDLVRFMMKDDVVVVESVKKSLFDFRGSVKPKAKPEDFKKVRQRVRKMMANEVIAETKD